MSGRISVAIIGAGSRGAMFADIIAKVPQWATVGAVAEPRAEYRQALAARHGIPAGRVFTDWREMRAKVCDAVVIATLDRDHTEPAVAFTRQGCHMLLEKPMATTIEECVRIAEAQAETATITSVCHSLRYHKGFAELKRVTASGRIGRIVTIDQLEQVAWWHQAHSFVRGNWGNEGRATFMLLAKSCHDIDFIAHLVEGDCQKVQSFGGLAYFSPANAPSGSGERCTACALESTCAYSAIKAYVDADREQWPASVVAATHDREAHLAAVAAGPYGRCVWKCDNDVVDHQVVCMEFDGGVTATFTMSAFTQAGGRRIRVHGTEGEIEFDEHGMTIRRFADANSEIVRFEQEEGGHGGGDERVMVSFLAAIREGNPGLVLTDVRESLRTHAIVFAAEKSRRQGRMVAMEEMT
jgi:predicted dehydrogenase